MLSNEESEAKNTLKGAESVEKKVIIYLLYAECHFKVGFIYTSRSYCLFKIAVHVSSSADTAKYVRIFVGYTKFTILSNENYGRGKKRR